MSKEIEQLKKDIAVQMEAWAAEFIQQRIAFLRKRKIKATGHLIQSFHSEINTQARQEAVELLIAFDKHGRFQDLRKMNAPDGGGDYIAAIQQWIKDKGLEQKMIQKYQRKKPGKLPSDVLNKIAWGIATKRTNKFKRKAWWNKPKSAAINDLFNEVAASIPDTVAEQIKKQFQQ